jgi:tetratricopeptide (TPR) repeat protein
MEAAETLARAAELLRRKGEVEPAFFAYERALAELADQIGSPTAAKLGAALEFELGKLCEEDLGRFEQALLHYQQAFKLRPDYLEPLRRGRLIYQSLGDMDMVARLIELHLANLVAGEAQQGVDLALELGQLKLRLHDPAGAVEVLRSALRMHNEATEDTEVPEATAGHAGRGVHVARLPAGHQRKRARAPQCQRHLFGPGQALS